jgi:GT2 family glycosyltransferase
MTDPRIGVVVLNWNGLEDTIGCVESVLAQDYRDVSIEVVDNGSHDGSPQRLRAWASARGVLAAGRGAGGSASEGTALHGRESAGASPTANLTVICNDTNLGFAGGNNVGIRHALREGADAVFLVNNDVRFAPDTLSRLVASLLSHPEWVGVAPKVVWSRDPERILYAGGRVRLWQARGLHLGRFRRDGPRWRGQRETEHLTVCCALYRADFLRAAGLLDEAFFFGHEDSALSAFARRSGRRVGVDLDVAVLHREGASLADREALSVYYFNKYRLLLVRRYGSRFDRAAAWSFLLASRPFKLLALLFRGRVDLVRAELRAYRDYVAGRLAEFDRARADGAERGAEP